MIQKTSFLNYKKKLNMEANYAIIANTRFLAWQKNP